MGSEPIDERLEAGGQGGDAAKRTRTDMALERRALLDSRFGLTAEDLDRLGRQAIKDACESPKPRERAMAARNILAIMQRLAEQEKQAAGIPDQVIIQQTAITGTDVRTDLLNDSDYLEFLRSRAVATDSEPGDVRQVGEQGPLEAGPTSGNGRSGPGKNGNGKAP